MSGLKMAKAGPEEFERTMGFVRVMEALFESRSFFSNEEDWREWDDDDEDKKMLLEIEKAITEFNMVHPNEQYKTIDCSDEVYEAIQFILGEGQYKKARTLEDVFLQLTNLRDSVDGMKSNLERMQFDLVDTMNNVDSQIEKLNKQKEGGEK